MPIDYTHEHTSRQIMRADAVKTPINPDSGGAISATDGQIVYMDGTDAVGSPNLTWETAGGNGNLGLAAGENGNATISGIGAGSQLTVQGQDGDATHVGGELTLKSGSSAGQGGGQLNIQSGNDGGGGDGGPIAIYSGQAATGASGAIDIKVGGSNPSLTGGDINITAGTSSGSDHGSTYIADGSTAFSIGATPTGIFVYGGVLNVDGLPTANPNVAGQLWNDAGTLKVSAG